MGGVFAEPRDVEEAVRLAAEHGPEARFVAGGTDLVVLARKRRRPVAPALIAIHRLADLLGVEEGEDGSVRIGAATSHAVLEAHPTVVERFTALADGSALVGSPATRHVGTLGGNLCNGSPAMDTGSPLLVFNAAVEVRSPDGTRVVPLEAFLQGPGRTAAGSGELVTAVTMPAPPSGATGSAYIRLDYRLAMEIAVVGAAALVTLGDDGLVSEARVALTAVAPTCVSVPAVGELLAGAEPTDDAVREAAEAAGAAARPIDDVRAPADYRRAMVPVIVRRALSVAIRRARGERIPVPATPAFGFTP